MTDRRYFSERDARALVGLRVQPRVTTIRIGLPWSKIRLVIRSGDRGTVTRFAWCSHDCFLVGVAWDRPRPGRPIDWYTEDEFRSLLGVPVEKAA